MRTGVPFTALEKRAVGSLAAVIGLRMIGLFLIVPVLALHAGEMPDATPLMVGVALGIYGLTQAALQIPFGFASDKWGRKPVISAGILIFAAGCVIAATADSLAGVAIGRAVQGAGAIAAAVFALVGDLTHDSQRNKAMAIMGVSIGAAFTLSFILAPLLDGWVGLQGLFWVAFSMALAGLIVLLLIVPSPAASSKAVRARVERKKLREVIFDLNLVRLYSGSFALHAVLTALFVAFPLTLLEVVQLDRGEVWKAYVPIILLSFVAMIPFISYSSRRSRTIEAMLAASLVLVAGAAAMYFGLQSAISLLVGFWLFFVGFNTLEALLPSTTIRLAPAELRGAALGAFNTCTFIGAFAGGIGGGAIYGILGAGGVFVFCGIVIGAWTLFAMTLRTAASSK